MIVDFVWVVFDRPDDDDASTFDFGHWVLDWICSFLRDGFGDTVLSLGSCEAWVDDRRLDFSVQWSVWGSNQGSMFLNERAE